MNSIKANVGGKERTFTFGLKVIGDLVKHFGQDPNEFAASLAVNAFHSVPALLYYAALYDVQIKKEAPDFELIDVFQWVEQEGLESETLDKITQVFFRSMYECVPTFKQLLDAPENEEVKKNLIGT